MLAWLASAAAHPEVDRGVTPALRDDAWERVVDIALAGPGGCFQASVTASWEHRSGRWKTSGSAQSTWRFDHRIWRLDHWEITSGDKHSLAVRVTPQLLGSSIHADQAYPMTRARMFRWPSPIATLPTRLFGQIQSVAIDELADGGHRVREAFDWDGWKEVEGELTVTVSPAVVPTEVSLVALDRWPDGCKVRSTGLATLDARGLPKMEQWTLAGRCPLRDWDGRWTFQFSGWKRCTFSGPKEQVAL